MTVPLPRFPVPRRALRAALALAFAAGTVFVTAAAVLWFWFLPHIADYRGDVARLMSRALGQRVTIDAVTADWRTWRPLIRMDGVRIHDHADHAALYLPRFEGRFAWRSLLFMEPRFSSIRLDGLTLAVRRLPGGRWLVGGLPVDPAAPDSGFANWALRQGEIRISGATLTWLDLAHAAPPLNLAGVELTLSNGLRRHALELHATPPAELARPFSAGVEFRGSPDTPATWKGSFEARFDALALGRLAAWADTPYWPRAGLASLRVEGDFASGAIREMRATLDAKRPALRLGETLPELAFDRLQGQLVWQHGTGERLAVRDLKASRDGETLVLPELAFGWSGEVRRVEAKQVDLGGLLRYAPYLPLPESLRQRLVEQRPAGRVQALDLSWRGGEQAELLALSAKASALSFAAAGAVPGAHGLDVQVEGNGAQGRFTAIGRNAQLELPQVFREPLLPLDRLDVAGGWQREGKATSIRLAGVRFANADLEGEVSGRYVYHPGQAGVADLEGRLIRADGTRVYRYLPLEVGDYTVDWVRDGVLAGGSRDVKFRLKGDLSHFPFDDGSGTFYVDSALEGGVLEFAPGWPKIDGIRARMLFERGAMRIETQQARIYGVSLLPVTAVIPDLMHGDHQLRIEGRAQGPAADFVRFTNESPVGERLRDVTRGMAADGRLDLTLMLDMPLQHSLDTKVRGRLNFLGGRLQPAGLPALEQARGALDFTEDTLAGKALAARLLGGPVRIAASTARDGKVTIEAAGRAGARGLAAWLQGDTARRFDGEAAWRGVLTLARGGDALEVTSDLVGLASTLPAPLAKPADAALPLTFSMRVADGGVLHEVRLGSELGAVWRAAADGRFESGQVRFGGAATLPTVPGLSVVGRAREIDLSGWLGLLPEGEGSGRTSIDLDLDGFAFMGRHFSRTRVSGRSGDNGFGLSVAGPDLDGTVNWQAASAGQPARLHAVLRRLAVPAATGGAATEADEPTLKPASLPQVDVSIDDFSLAGRTLGRLDALAHGTADGLAIDRLTIEHPDSRFDMSGQWHDSGNGTTRAKVRLEIADSGKFLTRFGMPNAVARGKSTLEGELDWPGAPADFALSRLAGNLDFKSSSGQFLKIEPGAGKLLGILSLQTLPRRLVFDFRDVFSDGYAYDDISATMRIARGVVYSDDFRMKGPAARVEMSGMASLDQETVQLRVKVTPKLSESVALAGALLGGPLAGVGALAAQKLLRDPFENAASREFLVSGGWQQPTVEKLDKKQPVKPQTK